MVIVSGSKMVDELRKRPDDELSFIEGVEEVRHQRLQTLQIGQPNGTVGSSCRHGSR